MECGVKVEVGICGRELRRVAKSVLIGWKVFGGEELGSEATLLLTGHLSFLTFILHTALVR